MLNGSGLFIVKSIINWALSNSVNACLDRSGSLGQPAYHNHGIRRDESLNAIIKYCYHNPVRAGLVKATLDYPFWRCKYEMEWGRSRISPKEPLQ